MATDMQKDVLMEFLSGTYVVILRSISKNEEDLRSLLELRDELHGSYDYEIDFDDVLKKLQNMRAKYE